MRRRLLPLFATIAALLPAMHAADTPAPAGMVLVAGGSFKSTRSNYSGSPVTLSDFYLGRHEVTQKEWVEVMGTNPSHFTGDDLPVDNVSWYECIEYCNRRSLKEGLRPCYTIDKTARDPTNACELDDLKWTVTLDRTADGYRLPTEAEWEYAAGGGQLSRSHIYSGSDTIAEIAWFWQNSGDAPLAGLWTWSAVEQNRGRTHAVGAKAPNELGLHDMSGNVREWCWDWIGDLGGDPADPQGPASGPARVWKGGGWMGGDFCCEPAFRAGFEPNGRGHDQGFRVSRNR
jgi:formylglycine-generating enzyme required for sulfatase activity